MAKKDKEQGPSTDVSESVPQIPDVPEPFLGFRSLEWDRKLQVLRSPQQRATMWRPGADQHASCPNHAHEPAQHGCTCGIYAGTQVLTAAPFTKVGNCFILVYGWGEVQPAANGWRAQFARIAALLRVAPEVSVEASQLRKLSRLYDVPLIKPHSAMIEDYRLLLEYADGDLDDEFAALIDKEGGGQ